MKPITFGWLNLSFTHIVMATWNTSDNKDDAIQAIIDAIAEKRDVPAKNVRDEFELKAAKKRGK